MSRLALSAWLLQTARVSSSHSAPAVESLKLLPETTKCLDGSPAGYYSSLNAASDVWVIYMQGGGNCYTVEDCSSRAKTRLGSSASWESTYSGQGAISRDCSFNPDFCEANHVYVRYCSGDAHRGQRTEPYQGFYISGHNNFKAIVSDLLASTPLGSAARVLLTGCSAGGTGTLVNADTLTEMLPHVIVKASPISGWFFPDSTEDHPDNQSWVPVSMPEDFEAGKASDPAPFEAYWSESMQWFDAALSAECVAASGAHCMNAPTAAAYVRTPLLISETMWDSSQLKHYNFKVSRPMSEPDRDWLAYYARAMQASTLKTGSRDGNGLFLPACIDHCGHVGGGSGKQALIDGFRYFDVLADWFFDRGQMKHVHTDACSTTDGCAQKLLQCRGASLAV